MCDTCVCCWRGCQRKWADRDVLQGSLDEAAEHLAFEKAVEAWRQGKDMPSVKSSCYQCYKLFYKVRPP